ncbi:cellulase family glycosylhydrolase [Nocardia sp. CA2R105]|uniref:cellulase family glycosylhydrolase n=1 Tax=Nocardia coffeae TaxID=2873381 RepID=UPI001CA6C991|nr:cellulase family glycosylhydrolase [Nocardia coffeae]MBY8862181.1 cellulase family glycosylhydrolase [Nocardia coffeae]
MTRFARMMRHLGVGVLLAAGCLQTPVATATPMNAELGHVGRWITDADGRVITLHGVNLVYKYPPFYPAAGGFGDRDAAFLAAHGINAVRLGFAWSAVEPRPGVYDDRYIGQIEDTQQVLARHGIYSLVDSHQDAFNKSVGASWDGFPGWATFSDGLPPGPIQGLFAAYTLSPAQNRTWANFWHDHPAPDGVGVQEHYAAMWSHVAQRFSGDRYVLGYDLINEPWPGITQPTCLLDGCPDFTRDTLAVLQAKAMTAIRRVDPRHLLFYEPFVTTDFGAPVRMPNPTGDPRAGMSFHDYCLGPIRTCPGNGFDSTRAADTAGLVTEFGATQDTALLERVTGSLDDAMASWMLWSSTQNELPGHSQQPPTGPDLISPAGPIVRPYPQVVAGTPQGWHFDPGTATFELRYTTARPDSGRPFAGDLRTQVYLPAADYPNGYRVDVHGADVVSAPNAELLQLRTTPGQSAVQLTVTRR